MQGSPASSLRKLPGPTLRCSLLRLCTDHPHGNQQDGQELGGERARSVIPLSLSQPPQFVAVPKLLELPGRITLRKSTSAGPSFSTLTLSLTRPYDEVACGLASVTFPTTEPPFFGVTRDEGRQA